MITSIDIGIGEYSMVGPISSVSVNEEPAAQRVEVRLHRNSQPVCVEDLQATTYSLKNGFAHRERQTTLLGQTLDFQA